MESIEQRASGNSYGEARQPDETRRRRDAITLFLQEPKTAAHRYPDLIEELCLFFLRSSNPYAAQLEHLEPRNEILHDNWEAARHWAAQHVAAH